MTSSVRYKYIENQTTAPLTINNFVSNCLINNDGDDKQVKVIKRIITVADIGGDPGELGDNYGAILDVIPITSTVLWFSAEVYRPQAGKIQGMTLYNNVNSDIQPLTLPAVPMTLTQTTLNFGLGLDNTLRISDKGWETAAALVVGDVVIAHVILGTKTSALDVMSP